MSWQAHEVRNKTITRELLENHWLSGTTCHTGFNKAFWVSDCGRFIIMKHTGHSEWCGGFTGQSYCHTKFALFVVGEEFPDIMGNSSHWNYGGRWSKARMVEVQEVIDGILVGK